MFLILSSIRMRRGKFDNNNKTKKNTSWTEQIFASLIVNFQVRHRNIAFKFIFPLHQSLVQLHHSEENYTRVVGSTEHCVSLSSWCRPVRKHRTIVSLQNNIQKMSVTRIFNRLKNWTSQPQDTVQDIRKYVRTFSWKIFAALIFIQFDAVFRISSHLGWIFRKSITSPLSYFLNKTLKNEICPRKHRKTHFGGCIHFAASDSWIPAQWLGNKAKPSIFH